MKIGRTVRYHGWADYPEGVAGTYRLRHLTFPAGHCFRTATDRTVLIGGQPARRVLYDYATRWHELSYAGGVWMTDLPIEQAQHDTLLAPIRAGSVLIGGLGLGYAATVLAQRPRISAVVVVEIAPEVITLVEPYVLREHPARRKLTIVRADLYEYLATTQEQFTWAVYDIWQQDSESTFFGAVVPLLQASPRIVARRPVCWNEDVMRGQLRLSLMSRLAAVLAGRGDPWPSLERLSTPVGSIWIDWSVPFFRWVRDVQAQAQKSADELQAMASLYADGFGLPGFHAAWTQMTGHVFAVITLPRDADGL